MQKNRSASVKRRKQDMSLSQESSTTAEKEAIQKKAKESSSVSEPTILSHFKLLEREDSVDSNMSSATAEIVHNYDSDTDSDCRMDSDIMRLLHTINALLNSRLEALGNRVEHLQGEVFFLQEENKKLRKEIGECRQREADMKGLVDQANMKGLVDQANMKGLVDQANMKGLVDQANMKGLVDQANRNAKLAEHRST